MADHKTIQLADDVADAINAANFGWYAERRIVPTFQKEDLDATLFVTVVPQSETSEAISRQHSQADRKIWLVVVKPLSQGSDDTFDNDEIDSVFDEVQQLETWLERRDMNGRRWISTDTDLLYDHDHLIQHREFYGIRTLTYRSLE
jgi:hypothetical protein